MSECEFLTGLLAAAAERLATLSSRIESAARDLDINGGI
jgi:hypothetical protein